MVEREERLHTLLGEVSCGTAAVGAATLKGVVEIRFLKLFCT